MKQIILWIVKKLLRHVPEYWLTYKGKDIKPVPAGFHIHKNPTGRKKKEA